MTEGKSRGEAVEAPNTPPLPARRDATEHTWHGVTVSDPYHWLEAMDSPAVKTYVAAENAYSFPYLESLPAREGLEKRLTELWNYERFGLPTLAGPHTFYLRNDGLQDQSVLYVEDESGAIRELLDPNQLSEDRTTSLANAIPSPDGRYLAYATSVGGSDWNVWRIKEVQSGKDLADELRHMKFSGVSWLPNGQGFFYSRYPVKDGVGDDKQSVRVHFHRIGTDAAEDPIVFELQGQTQRNGYATVSDDGRWLLISIREGFRTNAVSYAPLNGDSVGVIRPLFDQWDALYSFIGSDGDTAYFQTTKDASRGRVIAVALSAEGPGQIFEVVPEAEPVLESSSIVGNRLIVTYLENAHNRVFIRGLDGRLERELELPQKGTVSGYSGRIEDRLTHFSFSSFTAPPTLYRLDLETFESKVWRAAKTLHDPSEYTTEQHWYESKDGTRVSLWLVHRKDLQRNGTNPTLLYGYGGFNISLTPEYSPARIAWIERGGVLAIPNLRGGGEYGDAWHAAGTKLQKQNVFDDFIGAAEWLIREGYTAPQHLGIQGGSNGGLLVAACLVQRPELFGAALPAVGVLDMLRYDTASANARNWSSDYGLAENLDEFHALRAYSPVHNVRPDVAYPPTLITTGDHDDRVVPWHSYKFAAALRHGQSGPAPILLRVETRAGHGAGKPTSMRIEEVADQWAFLIEHLSP